MRVEPSRLDRLWLFPPLVRGRSERGVVAASCFVEDERRLLVTLAYQAQETGVGMSFHPVFQEEGEAPDARLPGVMEGVVQRFDGGPGPPRVVRLGGEPARLHALLEDLAPSLRSVLEG
jgi:hypothetical protein